MSPLKSLDDKMSSPVYSTVQNATEKVSEKPTEIVLKTVGNGDLRTMDKPVEICVCGRTIIDFPARVNLVAEITEAKTREVELTRELIDALQERIWAMQALDKAHDRIKKIVEDTGGPQSPFYDEYWGTPERPASIYDRPRRRTLRRTSATIQDRAVSRGMN
ncbi:uncharacterized protein LAJ45_01146 [Morchella importuna]|uniref:uncharacterized protein n=1 Tax=Morchella importuna TaxID=1174673 RepID=UPI001E8EEE0E|nr:uncharacterized protein LAJ45_01146 [Morchella importuna]KAH8154618.1 hypothetical protein LAJ45_01146 [Morchella importuna]